MAALSNPDLPYPPNAPDGPPYHMWPGRRIIQVGWGKPVYVSVYVTANRTGLGSGTPHVATVTLTDAAIKANCSIVVNTGGTFGSPYNAYFKLVVIKCPGVLSKANLFSLTLSGMTQQIDFDPPDYFCGTFSSIITFTFTGTSVTEVPSGLFIDGVEQVGHVYSNHYTYTWEYSDPTGITDSGSTEIVDPGTSTFPPRLPNRNESSSESTLMYYDNDGHLHYTGLSCDSTFPTGKVEIYPFDFLEVVINPQKDHVVTDPGISFFYDPAQAVKLKGSGDYEGLATSLWDMFLTNHLGTQISSGVGDGTINFKMQSALFSVRHKEKIIEIYPSNVIAGLRYDTFGGPGFRLNDFKKFPPPANAYRGNWGGTLPDFNNFIALFSGSPPPPVPYEPDSFPY